MDIKFLTMDCPKCDKQIKNSTWCLNTPINEFDVFEISQTEFECDNCGTRVFIGDIDYEVEENEDFEEQD